MTDEQVLHILLGLKDIMNIRGDTGYLSAIEKLIAEIRRRIEMEKRA